jgi:hypothetical protein
MCARPLDGLQVLDPVQARPPRSATTMCGTGRKLHRTRRLGNNPETGPGKRPATIDSLSATKT